MTTVISPASGAGIIYTQQGTGTTPGYSALDARRGDISVDQEGVFGTSTLVTAGGVSNVGQADFMVTQRAAGANLSVDINMPGGGFAWVQGDTINGQGLYCVPVHASNINEAIAAADVTNPRIDQLILEIQDNVHDASGGNLARTRVLTGTPTGGATLANRTGAAALPGSALLLADVLVAANATTVPNSVIRDRRKWARGAYVRQVLTSGSVTTASGTLAAISASLLARIECSGVPLRLSLWANVGQNTTNSSLLGCFMDGAGVDSTTGIGESLPASSGFASCGYTYVTTPAAGSHTFQPTFAEGGGGTTTLVATSANPAIFTLEEILKANAPNNVVTSG